DPLEGVEQQGIAPAVERGPVDESTSARHEDALDLEKYFAGAPVAQLDRALASGARGREFESPWARHLISKNQLIGETTSSVLLRSTAFLGTLGNNWLSRRFTASRCAITLACVYTSRVVAMSE